MHALFSWTNRHAGGDRSLREVIWYRSYSILSCRSFQDTGSNPIWLKRITWTVPHRKREGRRWNLQLLGSEINLTFPKTRLTRRNVFPVFNLMIRIDRESKSIALRSSQQIYCSFYCRLGRRSSKSWEQRRWLDWLQIIKEGGYEQSSHQSPSAGSNNELISKEANRTADRLPHVSPFVWGMGGGDVCQIVCRHNLQLHYCTHPLSNCSLLRPSQTEQWRKAFVMKSMFHGTSQSTFKFFLDSHDIEISPW